VFFPLDRYPSWLAQLVRLTPLYQGVAVERRLVLAAPDRWTPLHLAYLVAMVVVGLAIASRRLRLLLQP
jgi:lipooligosaccharide transport system permease protein